MDKQLRDMLKKVFLCDIFIGVIVAIIALSFFKNYTIIALSGLMLAAINFILNAVISNYVVMQAGNKSLNLLGAVFRISMTIIIAIILCGNDKNKYVATLVGYTFHYFAVIFYGLTANQNK